MIKKKRKQEIGTIVVRIKKDNDNFEIKYIKMNNSQLFSQGNDKMPISMSL